ncbi:MAG: 3D domain-containing protein [Candidatus Magasanikbacteria bacterium]|nr:3D domain-containing protein [Candidatus Magasanikbacteria bacterium]
MASNKPKNSITITKTVNVLAIVTLLVNILQPKVALAKVTDMVANAVSNANTVETVLKESEEGNMFPVAKPNKVVAAVITAYTSTPDQTDDSPFIAATGKRVHDGMIAANWLPFGTIVKIPSLYGDKEFIVEDRMNARYGYGRLDIWFDSSKAEAFKFGVKRVDVEVYFPVKTLTVAK